MKTIPLLLIVLLACKQPVTKGLSTDDATTKTVAPVITYDLEHPQRQWALPDTLKEISGIARVDKNHFLAIEDLHPALYLLRTDKEATVEKIMPFESTNKAKVDIEDIALHNDTAYALWSHGEIFSITNWRNTPVVKTFATPLNKDENTEGLCFDPVTGKLLIACKQASGVEDEKKSTRAVYSFNTSNGQLDDSPFLLVHKKDFEKTEGEKLAFYPSAIAVHPATGDIYLLSSRENKALAVYNRNGKLKSFQFLNKDLLPQPEGICFSPDGTLYISTQGRHGQSPMIYSFAAK